MISIGTDNYIVKFASKVINLIYIFSLVNEQTFMDFNDQLCWQENYFDLPATDSGGGTWCGNTL